MTNKNHQDVINHFVKEITDEIDKKILGKMICTDIGKNKNLALTHIHHENEIVSNYCKELLKNG